MLSLLNYTTSLPPTFFFPFHSLSLHESLAQNSAPKALRLGECELISFRARRISHPPSRYKVIDDGDEAQEEGE